MKTMKLVDLAKTIRSKNAGTDRITFDIIFRDPANYELVKKSGVLNKQFVCELFGMPMKSGQTSWPPAIMPRSKTRRAKPF